MSTHRKVIDYLDPDVSYFLGLLTARGEISEVGSVRRITIQFPFKNLQVVGIKKSFIQKNELELGLQPSIRRISELTEAAMRQDATEHSVVLTIESLKNTMFWRDIRLLMGGGQSHLEFQIPKEIYEADDVIKKEFLRGYADVAGSARTSNVDQAGKHRVYLDVLNPNWHLPVQLCHLMQDHLQIPLQTITYGHPNLRDPKGKEYKAGRKDAWAREHQLKIYCEAFEKVGFYMKHKQEILVELAGYNRKKFGRAHFCNPPKRLGESKFKHPGEKSDKLPKEIRGRHYMSYWQICGDLGCPRQAKCLPIFSPYMKTRQQTLPST